jgi:outer membrane lipoprotein
MKNNQERNKKDCVRTSGLTERTIMQFREGKEMGRNGFLSFLLFCMSVFLVSSCASPISKQFREEANPTLTFPQVLENPKKYVGSIVIWGGVIIDTINLPHRTEIIVLETPLGTREKPKAREYSQGRFIARSSRYLDPEIYKKGRKVTIAGEIIGEKIKLLGKMKYMYPVIKIKQLHIWRRESGIYPPSYYSGYYGNWYGYYPYNWGYWDGGDFDEGDFDAGDFDEGDEGR